MTSKNTDLRKIIVNSRKFDNSIHRSWNCTLLEENDELWIFAGEFESEIRHPKLGIIRRGTISYEYYWKHKWFNIFRFHEPEGELKFYYCNVNMPPKLENNALDYIDMDVDILVQKDLSFEILDEDEFEENSIKFDYPEEVKLKTRKSIEKLLEKINEKAFPFDYQES